jgi:hypothetical protein
LESPETRLKSIRSVDLQLHPCQACTHLSTVTHRTLELILRAADDPFTREVYGEKAGICLRHAIQAARVADDPAKLSFVLKTEETRLRILEWELQEHSRKENWSVRYEPAGVEASAWMRAAYQLCGAAV